MTDILNIQNITLSFRSEQLGNSRASLKFKKCKEGQTILSNYKIKNDNSYITFSFFQRINGEMIKKTVYKTIEEFKNIKWDYIVTDFFNI